MKKDSFCVAPMFSDHMVLQREKEIVIWGCGPEGERVTVTLGNTTAETTVDENQWRLTLGPLSAGGPYSLEVICGAERTSFQDVMIGEVWFAGGQSNMELELQNCDNAEEELKNANYEGIRFYNVIKTGVITEEILEQQRNSQWRVCRPELVKDVSAVAYFCARKLHQELGIAIGVIDCYIGGTSATGWMDEETLMSTPETRAYVKAYDERIGDKTDEQYAEEMAEYNRQWQEWDNGVQAERKKNPEVTWEYLNEHVGICPWPQPAGRTSNFRPGNPYAAMMTRVIPYTIRGFWYYQGEEDSCNAENYGVLMKCLIELWRRKWQDENTPFILNQLPMYIAKGEKDDKNWAVLREQQRLTAQNIPDTYMNVLIDCGEFDNIHPTDKQTVGWRLALQCLEHVYGISCNGDSPVQTAVRREKNQVIVTFDCRKLMVKGREITLFELAGSDGIFYPAQAELYAPQEVAVTSEQVEMPVAVRYAWTNFGQVTLYGENELPAAPFLATI